MNDMTPILERFQPPWPRSLAIGEGWYPLILRLDKQMAEIDPDYSLLQVKEKFGGLRYYYLFSYDPSSLDAERVRDLVYAAEAESFKTCEECGAKPATQTKSGWIKTLCQECMR